MNAEVMPGGLRTEILGRQAGAMKQAGLDAMVSCSPENFAYATGFVIPSQSLMRHRFAMAIVKPDASLSLFAVDMEETTVARQAPGVPLAIWKEFSDDPMAILADAFRQGGLASARIGMELEYLPAAEFARLSAFLPNATFVAIDKTLSRLRQLKTAGEIALLRRLSRIADQAIKSSLEAVTVGSTELDIAAHLTRNIYELGAENFKMLITATGPRSELPNVGPTDRRLARGDICRVEIFSVIGGYQAGVCRTAYVVEPPPMAEEIWQLMVDCKYRILEQAKPRRRLPCDLSGFYRSAGHQESSADLIRRSRHRASSARRSLYRFDAVAWPAGQGRSARGEHGAGLRTALLPHRLRLRRPEQGHDADHGRRLRATVGRHQHRQTHTDRLIARCRTFPPSPSRTCPSGSRAEPVR